MRITSIVVHSDESLEDIEFAIRDDSQDRYIVRSIVGIDADELIPKFYRASTVSRVKYYEFTMRQREIAMRLVLNPRYQVNESVSEIRDRLYRLISSTRKGSLDLEFKSGGSTFATISGMITKMEVAHFAQVPEVQVTFECPDPIFRSVHPIDYAPADLPTANPILLPDSHSNAPHGFSFAVEFTASVATFTIQDDPTTPNWRFRVSPAGGFLSGDELYFSSEYARKELYMIRSAVTTHIMDKVADDAVWPQVFPGANPLYFLNVASFDWLSLSYHAAYWGL